MPPPTALRTCRSLRERPSRPGSSSSMRRTADARKGSGEIAAEKRLKPLRRRRAEGSPGVRGERELLWRDRLLQGSERLDLDLGLTPEELGRLHQEERAVCVHRLAAEPVEDLQELELVVEIVLEPQDDAVERRRMGEPAVARLQIGRNLLPLAPAPVRQILGADRGQLGERASRRHRPLMQHVAPRQHLCARNRAAKQFAGRIAIGDDEVRTAISRGRGRAPRPGRAATRRRAACPSARTRRSACRRADTNSRRCAASAARSARRGAWRWRSCSPRGRRRGCGRREDKASAISIRPATRSGT